MKKILSLCLVVTMLLTLGLVFAGCVDKAEPLGDPTKDPSVMPQVYANTAAAFIGDEVAAATLASALKNGSLDIQVALEDVGTSPLSIRETIYNNAETGKFVSDTLLSLMGEDYAATIWGAPGSLAVGSESIFGSKTAYGISLSSLISGLEGSALADMLEIPAEAMDTIIELLTALNTPASNDKSDKDPAETTALQGFVASLPEKVNAMYHMTATPEAVESEDGKVEYLVVTYRINNDTMKQFLDLLTDAAILIAGEEATEEDVAELTGEMAAILESFNNGMDFDITETVYILVEDKVVEKSELTINITEKEGDDNAEYETVTGTLITTFSDTQIGMNLELGAMGETIKATATIDKKVEGEVTTYTITANGGTKNVTADLINASLVYDKAADKLTLAGDIMMDETSRAEFRIEADYKVSAEEISLSLVSATANGETVTFGDKNKVALTIKAAAELPAEPADTRDIVTLSEEEWGELIAGIMESPVGQLIGSLAKPSIPTDIVSYQLSENFFITVPRSMQQVAIDGCTAAFECEDAAVLVIRQERRELMKEGIRDVRDYIRELGKGAAALTMADMERFDSGDYYFEFTADNGFRYLVTAHFDGEYYWAVYYAADEATYEDNYRPLFLEAAEGLFAVNGNP